MHLSWCLVLLLLSLSGYECVPLLMALTRKISLAEDTDPTNQTILPSTGNHVIAVDYHLARGEVYFSDALGQIHRSWLRSDGSDSVRHPVVIAEVKLADGLAVDWVNDRLYWTDTERRTLEVATLDGLHRRVLFNATDGLQKPRAIVVDPSKGLMFWSDWGSTPKVESAGLDGNGKITIVHFDIQWPNGLALDLRSSTLYILDGYRSTISSCNYDGTRFKVIFKSELHGLALQGFGLTYYANNLYWNSWHTRAMFKMSTRDLKVNKIIQQTGIESLRERFMGLKAVHASLQPKTSTQNVCKTASCSHICLLSRDLTPTCSCPFGFTLSDDGKTCTEDGYLIVSWRRTIRRYRITSQREEESLIDTVSAAISIGYHLQQNLIFWSDVEEHRIYRAPLDQLNNKTVVASPETSDGLAVDWVHDVLYWTDTRRKTIEAASLDGSKPMVIFDKDLDQPRDIALDPFEGLLFWCDWGGDTKIERSTLDGLERQIIIGDSHVWPNGITIDIPSKTIYYVDGKVGAIYSSSYDGTERSAIFEPPNLITLHLFAITHLKDELFWTDWETRGLYRSAKKDITNARSIATSNSTYLRPNGIKAIHSSLQEPRENPCAKVNCQNLCLGTKSHTAHCMGEEEVKEPSVAVQIDERMKEDSAPELSSGNLQCDGRDECPAGSSDEHVSLNAAIKKAVVYKKSRSEVYFRVDVTKGTKMNLDRFEGSYTNTKSNITEWFERTPEPCVMWPESYCFHISSLQPYTTYDFKIAAELKGGKVGNKYIVSAITKEEASGPPENLQVTTHNATCLIYQWHYPNQSNGIVRSFMINIDEFETFEEERCCQSFPIIELPVSEEESHFETATTGLTPAASYAISISAKNVFIGASATIMVNTPPPPMKVLKAPKVEVASLQPLSWQTQNDQGESSKYHSLIRSYLLVLLSSKIEQTNLNPIIKLDPTLTDLLLSKFGGRLEVLWMKTVEETNAFQTPIKVANLTAHKQYKFAWVQVAQYKDAYSMDYLQSDLFIAL